MIETAIFRSKKDMVAGDRFTGYRLEERQKSNGKYVLMITKYKAIWKTFVEHKTKTETISKTSTIKQKIEELKQAGNYLFIHEISGYEMDGGKFVYRQENFLGENKDETLLVYTNKDGTDITKI